MTTAARSTSERFARRQFEARAANLAAMGLRTLSRILEGAIVLAALALATGLLAPARATIELAYSTGLYPVIDRAARSVTDLFPFSLGDALFVALIAAFAVGLWATLARTVATRRGWALLAFARRTIVVLAAVYLWFLASWGWNYLRVPVAEKLVLHQERTNEDAVTALANRTLGELNRYAEPAHRETHDGAETAALLRPAFEAVIARLGDRTAFSAPPAKPTIFEFFMKASGSQGFTNPWTHEIDLDGSTFPFERPATFAHEWGHIAGFADESEANYISVLTCTTSADPLLRYSGWLLVWFNLPSDVHVTQRAAPQVYADIEALQKRNERQVKPAVARAQQAAYGQYLRANHVKAGYGSYRLFIRLLTAADYDASGLPVVRGGLAPGSPVTPFEDR
jgi:hypothetical protein